MRDLWADFNPARQRDFQQNLNKILQSWKDNRDCYVCKSCLDISDKWNTCHICQHTNDLIPKEHTCLLWDLKEEEENE